MSFSISNVELSRSLIGPSEALTVSFDLTHNMSKRLANLSMYIRYASTVYYVVKQVQIPANQARNTTVHYIVDVNTCGSSESGSVFAEMISGNYRRYTDSLTFTWRAFDEAGSYYDYVSASIPGNILIDRRCMPAVNTLQLERAANGVPDDEGENLMATIKLSLADTTWVSGMTCRLHYAQGSTVDDTAPHIDLTSSLSDLLAGVSGDATLIAQTFARNSDWAFLLVFGDVETGQGLCEVSRAFANLHLSGASTGGAAFGRFSTSSEGDPKLESEYPLYAYAGIADFGGSIQCGNVAALGNTSSGSYKDAVVTFPKAFAAGTTPFVMVGFASGSTSGNFGRGCVAVLPGSVTNTEFTLRFFNGDSSARNPEFVWIAIGQV